MLMLKHAEIIVQGKVVARTRWPWWHSNFGGWSGWRMAFEKALRKDGHKSLYILGRFFRHLVFIDADQSAFWMWPRIETTQDMMSIRAGWIYWALCITKKPWYPNPKRYMPGFAKLPYASEALAARYYPHDAQAEGKDIGFWSPQRPFWKAVFWLDVVIAIILVAYYGTAWLAGGV